MKPCRWWTPWRHRWVRDRETKFGWLSSTGSTGWHTCSRCGRRGQHPMLGRRVG